MFVMSMCVFVYVCTKERKQLCPRQETMKKGISSLSTNPTGQQIISIIDAVAISPSCTAPHETHEKECAASVVLIQPLSTKSVCTYV